jgi:hypothetical protein
MGIISKSLVNALKKGHHKKQSLKIIADVTRAQIDQIAKFNGYKNDCRQEQSTKMLWDYMVMSRELREPSSKFPFSNLICMLRKQTR